VLVNASSARVGGGQTYLSNLLASIPPPEQVTVYLLADDSLQVGVPAPNLIRLPAPRLLANPIFRALWERTRLPALIRRLEIDVLFCPGGVVGTNVPAGCATVTMFRNMLPFDRSQLMRHPLIWPRLRIWLLRRVMAASMQRADLVIFVSEWARQQINRQLPGGVKRDVTIHHGLDEMFHHGSPRASWMPDRPYLLYVSFVEFYKSQVEVVRGYAQFRERSKSDLALVLAGANNTSYARDVEREIERLGLQQHVILPGKIPHADLPNLYRGATAVLFASQCENCPNILLESLAAGRPVLSSSMPPMPEFGADAVLYFDPRRPEELADRLCTLFADPELAAKLGSAARRRSQDFDWGVTRTRTWSALIDIAVET
jgi:glycosyltransferase involved in cell wall biosynthesis